MTDKGLLIRIYILKELKIGKINYPTDKWK